MELTKLVSLLSKVDDAIDDGDHLEALALLLANFSKFDDDSLLRERAAVVLAETGRKKEAVDVWDRVARHYANAGRPARSLAAIKQMQALRPDSTVLLDHFTALYNIRSPYLADEVEPTEVPQPTADIDLDPDEQADQDELLERAYAAAIDEAKLLDDPQDLTPLPLLSLLPSEALRRVLDYLEYEVYAEPEPVLETGKQTDDLIWTVTADFTIEDTDPKLRLPSGTLLGLNSFGRSAAPARANIFSTKHSELLRLSAEAIDQLDEQLGDFRNRLATLRRHALTEGLLERHPMVAPLQADERVDLMQSFTGLRVSAGEKLIVQGQPSPGIFLVLDGHVDIIRNDDDWEITIATLSAGDVFGEIGVVSDNPAVAACVMTTAGHLLFLPRGDFGGVAERYPAVAKYAVNLANERMQDVESTLSANDLAEVEE